jgi:hypothetical protein
VKSIIEIIEPLVFPGYRIVRISAFEIETSIFITSFIQVQVHDQLKSCKGYTFNVVVVDETLVTIFATWRGSLTNNTVPHF